PRTRGQGWRSAPKRWPWRLEGRGAASEAQRERRRHVGDEEGGRRGKRHQKQRQREPVPLPQRAERNKNHQHEKRVDHGWLSDAVGRAYHGGRRSQIPCRFAAISP